MNGLRTPVDFDPLRLVDCVYLESCVFVVVDILMKPHNFVIVSPGGRTDV